MVGLKATTGITPALEVELIVSAALAEVVDTNRQPGIRVAIRKKQGKRKPDHIVWARLRWLRTCDA